MNNDCSKPDWHEIIAQLRLEAGRIMEDTADELARALPKDHPGIGTAIGYARQAGDDIQSLLAAEQILHRRC
ncbi:hypothetical protein, partial [Rhizobium leguminosarum]|uniref:hypothetical protein n=1 Tax=Rhizobium leguminosarum TaxID=384 RepID=UPI003F9BD960